jgi:EAL domain-containing protein (putative c-di-GMP-specific phosphodiesterase class I)
VNKPTASKGRHDESSDLARALETDQFFLVYQPTIDLQSNAFAGVESLLRWRHPLRGILSPEDFLAELDQTGLIVSVGQWILLTACAQGATWHEKGYRFPVSVNVSVNQFDGTIFDHDVENALSTTSFDPSLLVLEFPYSILADDDGTVASRLEHLSFLGVRLAIDDLRPSDTALATIENYPISVLKLDRRFTAELPASDAADVFVQQLVQFAKTRKLQIIASGVEDVEQRRQLQSDDVEIGQGFLFSEPREAADIDRFLENFSIFSGKPL